MPVRPGVLPIAGPLAAHCLPVAGLRLGMRGGGAGKRGGGRRGITTPRMRLYVGVLPPVDPPPAIERAPVPRMPATTRAKDCLAALMSSRSVTGPLRGLKNLQAMHLKFERLDLNSSGASRSKVQHAAQHGRGLVISAQPEGEERRGGGG